MEKKIKKITLKKETISNLNNSQMSGVLGGNMSNKTLPYQAGCDSVAYACCTYNQCGGIQPTAQLCNTYKEQTCYQDSMYGNTCGHCATNRCTGVGSDDGCVNP